VGTSPTPTISGLAITSSNDLLKINQAQTFTATATMSNGSTAVVPATWRSDNPAVATVDANGRVTGIGAGETAISAESSGVRATPRSIRVVPDYQGRWSGDWRVASCTADGDWTRTDVCRDAPVNSQFPFVLALTQDRDTAGGNVQLDDLAGPVQGSIRVSGQLSITGTVSFVEEGIVFEWTVADWETLTTDNQRMTGRFTISFRTSGLQGSVRLNGELRAVSKTAGTLLPPTGAESRLRRALIAAARR
jgi:hypothetical protein